MNKKIVIKVVLILLWMLSTCCASEGKKACECPKCATAEQAIEGKTNKVDAVLKQLNQKTSELKSFQAQVEYKFIQPLLESEKLQKGDFYYAKLGNNSKLRLNFKTSQIDDEDEEKYVEEYIVLDGAGLSHPSSKGCGLCRLTTKWRELGIFN